jgi:dihydrolipoyl dehydrogenase
MREDDLFAIGDVAGPPWLAHKASHEGIHCVEHIAGCAPTELEVPVPACTYSDPQIASVGLTVEQARQTYGSIEVGRFPFRFNGRALSAGRQKDSSRRCSTAAAAGFWEPI